MKSHAEASISTQIVEQPPQLLNRDDADVVLESTRMEDGRQYVTRFKVHKIFLALSSSFFASMFDLPLPEDKLALASDNKDEQGRAVIPFSEHPKVTGDLLSMCYSFGVHSIHDISDLPPLLELCAKYEMSPIESRLRETLRSLIAAHPFRTFFIACRFQFKEEALLAARETLAHSSFPPWVKEMDDVSGSVVHCLMDYRRKCSDRVSKVASALSTWTWIPPTSNWLTCTSCAAYSLVCTTQTNAQQHVRAWFAEFMLATAEQLKEKPHISYVIDEALISAHLVKPTSCGNCRLHGSPSVFHRERV